jgi:hypothetical protein
MTNSLTFHSQALELINGEWIRGYAICATLGYKSPDKALKDLYVRHQDEFTSSMTRLLKIGTNGGAQIVRVFSLRGAHLLAMFSRTPIAKEFRKWVLDILDKETRPLEQSVQQQLPLPAPKDSMIDYYLREAFINALNIGEEAKVAREFLEEMPYIPTRFDVEQHLQAITRMQQNMSHAIGYVATKLLPGGTPKTKKMIEHLLA